MIFYILLISAIVKLLKNNININKENQIKISQNISEIKPEESKSNINKSIETNTSKMDKTDEKEKSISYQIGYLSQLKRNQQKHIKNLEEKEIQRKNLSKLKINKKFEEPNEVKLGRIYTTLGQKKSVKYKTGSVHRDKIDNIKNIIKINNNMFNDMKGINNNNQNNIVNNNNINNNQDNNELPFGRIERLITCCTKLGIRRFYDLDKLIILNIKLQILKQIQLVLNLRI